MRRTRRILLTTALALLVPAGAAQALTVYGASSLSNVLPQIDGTATYSFGASNTLQAQIERGAPADVFASASPDEAQALYRKGLCARPVTFATNKLVLAVPASGSSVRSVYDLKAGGKRLAIGAPGVPIGVYTRKLLARLRLSSVLSRNTVSNESNVSQVAAKVGLASADAGFVYVTDALANTGRITAIKLPVWAQPPVKYQACVVRPAAGASTYLTTLTSTRGRSQLKSAGFGLPAKPKAKKKRT